MGTRGEAGRVAVLDLIYVGVIVGFFVASALYVRFCGKL
jgi:hypothetical protein